jgi:hypothetical protein
VKRPPQPENESALEQVWKMVSGRPADADAVPMGRDLPKDSELYRLWKEQCGAMWEHMTPQERGEDD